MLFLLLNNEYMIYKIKIKIKIKKAIISLVLYSTWYFIHDSCISEYNVLYSESKIHAKNQRTLTLSFC